MTTNRLTVTLLLWLLCLSAPAQNTITTLKRQLALAKMDTSRSRILYDLGVQYEEVNHDSSVYFLTRALPLAQRSHNQKAIAQVMYRLGYMQLYYLSDDAKAVAWLNKGIVVARKNHDTLNLARCYQYIAVIAYKQQIGNPEEIAGQALGYARKANDWRVLADTYAIMNFIHKKTNPRQAEVDDVLGMAICKKHDLVRWFGLGLDYCSQLDRQGKYVQAQAFYRKLMVVKPKLIIRPGDYNPMMNLAMFETRLKNHAGAEQIYLTILANEQAKARPDTFRLLNTYSYLLEVYTSQPNYRKAYELDEKRIKLSVWSVKKSLTKDSQIQMTQLKASLDMEKKEAEIALMAQQQKQQRTYLIGAVGMVVLLLGFAFILHRNRQRIERQRTELGQLNATKDKLFAILSHDLRSPVASLKNYLMLINWGALSKEEFAESAQDLTGQLNNVHTMLENVLTWSISQMGGMHPRAEQLDLSPIIEEQIQVLLPVAQAKGIHIENHIPAHAHLKADRNHLAVILRNLLQNALKFTNKGGTVRLVYEQQNGDCILTVQDTGIGLNKVHLKNLFQLCKSTSQPGTANEHGTGMGLILVKELVEANQGRIRIESQVEAGTTVWLTFAQTLKPVKAVEPQEITPVSER